MTKVRRARQFIYGAILLSTSVMLALPALTTKALADDSWWVPNISGIIHDGGNEVLASGWSYHDPATYSERRRDKLNQWNVGAGYARYLENPEHDSVELLFAQGFSDSIRKPQFVAGYAKYWNATVIDNLKVGAGYAIGITQRQDALRGVPFPLVLPVVTVTVSDRIQIFGTYIPPLPSSMSMKTDVFFIFAGFRF